MLEDAQQLYDSIYEYANVSIFSRHPETVYFAIRKLCEKTGSKFDCSYLTEIFPDGTFTTTDFDQTVSRTKSFQKLFGLKNGCRFLIDTFC